MLEAERWHLCYVNETLTLLTLSCCCSVWAAPAWASRHLQDKQVKEGTSLMFMWQRDCLFNRFCQPCFQMFFPVENSVLSEKRETCQQRGEHWFRRAQSCLLLWNSEDKGEHPTMSFVILLWSYSTGYDIRQDAVVSIQHDSRLCVITMVSG